MLGVDKSVDGAPELIVPRYTLHYTNPLSRSEYEYEHEHEHEYDHIFWTPNKSMKMCGKASKQNSLKGNFKLMCTLQKWTQIFWQ